MFGSDPKRSRDLASSGALVCEITFGFETLHGFVLYTYHDFVVRCKPHLAMPIARQVVRSERLYALPEMTTCRLLLLPIYLPNHGFP